MSLDKNVLKKYCNEAESLLKSLEQKYGIRAELAGGSIRQVETIMKIKLTTANTEDLSLAFKTEFEKGCGFFGIPKDVWGKIGKTGLEIVKLDFSKKKYPFICSRPDGRQYKLNADQICREFGVSKSFGNVAIHQI